MTKTFVNPPTVDDFTFTTEFHIKQLCGSQKFAANANQTFVFINLPEILHLSWQKCI